MNTTFDAITCLFPLFQGFSFAYTFTVIRVYYVTNKILTMMEFITTNQKIELNVLNKKNSACLLYTTYRIDDWRRYLVIVLSSKFFLNCRIPTWQTKAEHCGSNFNFQCTNACIVLDDAFSKSFQIIHMKS